MAEPNKGAATEIAAVVPSLSASRRVSLSSIALADFDRNRVSRPGLLVRETTCNRTVFLAFEPMEIDAPRVPARRATTTFISRLGDAHPGVSSEGFYGVGKLYNGCVEI